MSFQTEDTNSSRPRLQIQFGDFLNAPDEPPSQLEDSECSAKTKQTDMPNRCDHTSRGISLQSTGPKVEPSNSTRGSSGCVELRTESKAVSRPQQKFIYPSPLVGTDMVWSRSDEKPGYHILQYRSQRRYVFGVDGRELAIVTPVTWYDTSNRDIYCGWTADWTNHSGLEEDKEQLTRLLKDDRTGEIAFVKQSHSQGEQFDVEALHRRWTSASKPITRRWAEMLGVRVSKKYSAFCPDGSWAYRQDNGMMSFA